MEIYELYLASGKKYVCLRGDEYKFLDEYDNHYDLCTDNYNVVLAYEHIKKIPPVFVPILLAELGYNGATEIEVNPPFTLYNNAVYVYIGKMLRLDSHVLVKKTSKGYNDDGEPIVTFEAYDDLNPMQINSIGYCAELVFTYNKKIDCGIHGVIVR
ncbi:virion structural protein [Betalipothrixvirus pezzuloense]|uniref:Uncharacterized protein n=1 Tax=Betalipothrixvirus pezzuloense TaxID=346883 RepID=A7WKQ0_9VIRU|nr:virion structural protein [Acidianus filamentous virus 7]CAJ31652.1 conserved hypothetical protein [Acidianus filamentous virus 7]